MPLHSPRCQDRSTGKSGTLRFISRWLTPEHNFRYLMGRMTSVESSRRSLWARLTSATDFGGQLLFAYVALLAVSAWIGHWTPEYLAGRTWWHFAISRMLVPMVALGALSAWARLVPAAFLLSTMLLFIGAVSAVKQEATGEPFQTSDFFLASQGTSLLGYADWRIIWPAALVIAASIYFVVNARIRLWSAPLFAICLGLLSTYRFEAVVNFIHDHAAPWGLNNLPFNQAESERMNGLATHLYFST